MVSVLRSLVSVLGERRGEENRVFLERGEERMFLERGKESVFEERRGEYIVLGERREEQLVVKELCKRVDGCERTS